MKVKGPSLERVTRLRKIWENEPALEILGTSPVEQLFIIGNDIEENLKRGGLVYGTLIPYVSTSPINNFYKQAGINNVLQTTRTESLSERIRRFFNRHIKNT